MKSENTPGRGAMADLDANGGNVPSSFCKPSSKLISASFMAVLFTCFRVAQSFPGEKENQS